MTHIRIRETLMLFLGDVFFFVLALWLTLLVRHQVLPSQDLFYNHLIPFSLLFVVWVLVFFIAGLYGKHTMPFRIRLPKIILNAQIANLIIAALFFFFIPYFGITPKTNLAIYLTISFFLIVVWRLYLFPLLHIRNKQNAVVLASGKEARELIEEVNNNTRYSFVCVDQISPAQIKSKMQFQTEFSSLVKKQNISLVIIDISHDKSESLAPFFSNFQLFAMPLRFLDFDQLYEDIFDKVPLAHTRYDDFIGQSAASSHIMYDVFKRTMDIIGSLLLGAATLVCYPFIALAIKLEDGGPVFFSQQRVGKNNKQMIIYKFRTMKRVEDPKWSGESDNKPTRVGNILRKISVDEWPQFWNILKGELSLIGPRSDAGQLAQRLQEEIPYYNLRYAITPGISGWAQIKQYYSPGNISPQTIEENRVRLAYDLYYIKNRSLFLDIRIALQTLKALVARFV